MNKRGRLEKALDKEIEQVYYEIACGVQVSVLDIPKIFRDAKLEHSAGKSIREAMPAIIARYRQN